MLTTVFDASAPAIAATTGAFMAGRAAGSPLAAKHRLTPRKSAAACALLECIVAACALAMPTVPQIAGKLPDPAGSAADQPILRNCVRFAAVFLLLPLSTALMGVTVPVMARTFHRSRRSHENPFAWLDSMNTFDAVLGALLTGFVLIPQLEFTGTVRLAAALDCGAAAAAWTLLRPLLPRNETVRCLADTEPAADDTATVSATEAAAAETAGASDFAPAVTASVADPVSLAAQHLWPR